MTLFLFDLDGTLVHFEETLVATRVNKILTKLAIPHVNHDVAMRLWFEHVDRELYASYNISTDEFWRTWGELFSYSANDEERWSHTKAFDDVTFLNQIKDSGAKMCLLTGSPLDIAKRELEIVYEKTGQRVFDDIVVANPRFQDVDFKPSPKCVAVALEKMQGKKEDTYLVGNGIEDMQCAKNAGVKGILIERNENAKFVKVETFARIKTLHELKKFL